MKIHWGKSIFGIILLSVLYGSINFSSAQYNVDPMGEQNRQWQEQIKMGNLAFQKKEFLYAIEVYQKAMEIKPEETSPRLKIAECYFQLKDYEKAKEAFVAFLKLEPQNTHARNYLGYIYEEILKDYNAAAVQYEKSLAIDPQSLQPLIHLGLVYKQLKKYDDAERVLGQALKIDPKAVQPESRNLHNYLGLVFSEKGDTKKAVAEFRKTLSHFPEDTWADKQLKALEGNIDTPEKTNPPSLAPQPYIISFNRPQERDYFNRTLESIGISEGTREKLKDTDVKTISELQKKGDLKKVEALKGISDQEMKKLKRASLFSLFSKDIELNGELAKKEINSVSDLNKLSVNDLIEASGGKLDRKGAAEYKAKVRGLVNLANIENLHLAAQIKNPAPLYGPAPLSGEARAIVRSDFPASELFEEECRECNESNNLFSPAVYLLYLLDFVKKTFDTKLNTLEGIDHTFYQKFEDLSIFQDISKTVSYVQLSNEILENLIAQLEGKAWPNEIVSPPERAAREQIKNDIYEKFKSPDYRNEPGFDPNVLIDLFNAYVREFDVTRQDVRFIMNGTPALKQYFATEHDLELTDLEAMNVQDGNISLRNIQDLKARLLAFYKRKLENTVEQEFISDIEDEKRREFQKHFRQFQTDEVEQTITELIKNISGLPAEVYEQEYLKKREQGRACVTLGEGCLDGSKYKGKPISPIRELFKHFAEAYPDYTAGGNKDAYADNKLANLETEIQDQRFNQLKTEDPTATDAEAKALAFAKERIRSEEEFDQQLHKLAGHVFDKEIQVQENKMAFDHEVNSRAEEQWQIAVSRAETSYLAKIRSNLICIALKMIRSIPLQPPENINGRSTYVHPANIKLLANYLNLDLTVDETYRTTPLSFAINRIHTFIQAVQLGTVSYDTTAFNKETWAWLKSYGTWHAAMLVSLYPENFLIPELRQGRTSQFQAAMDNLDELGVEETVNRYTREIDLFRDMRLVKSLVAEDNIFIFALAKGNEEIYYSVINKTGQWKGWERLPADIDPYFGHWSDIEMLYVDGYLHMFAVSGPKEPWNKVSLNHMSITVVNDKIGNAEAIEDNSSNTQSSLGSWKEVDVIELKQDTYERVHFVVTQGGLTQTGEMILRAMVISHEIDIQQAQDFKVHNGDIQKLGPLVEKPLGGFFELLDLRGVKSVQNSDSLLWEIGPGDDLFLGQDSNTIYKGHIANNVEHGFYGGFSPKPDEILVYYRYSGNGKDYVRRQFKKGNNWHSDPDRIEERNGIGDSSAQVGKIGENVYFLFNEPEIEKAEFLFSCSLDFQNLFDRRTMRTIDTPESIVNIFDDNGITLSDFADCMILIKGREWLIKDGKKAFYVSKEENILKVFSAESFWKLYYKNLGNPDQKPSNLSLPPISSNVAGKIGFDKTLMRDQFSKMDENDDARIYLEEYYLHLPVMIAEYLNENQRYEEAMEWLKKVYDPFQPTEEERRIYPDFSPDASNQFSARAIGKWLKEPFNPYALANLHKESHLLNVKFAHVKNLLDWADHLFIQDTSESVNRARELYELAGKILELHNWPQNPCELQWWWFHVEKRNTSARLASKFREAVSSLSGIPSDGIAAKAGETLGSDVSVPFTIASLKSIKSENKNKDIQVTVRELMDEASKRDDISTTTNTLASTSDNVPDMVGTITPVDAPEEIAIGAEIPELKPFCLPMNPLLNLLRWRIGSNLMKIMTNRNYAGMQRAMQPYATPVDPRKLVKLAASGGEMDFDQFIPSTPPPVYRYSFLLERSKYLISVAQQLEGSMLSSLKIGDEESYSLMKAKQDLGLERANVTLQGLRVKEADDSVTLAENQKERAQFSSDHFLQLSQEMASTSELAALILLDLSTGVPSSVSVGLTSVETSYSPSGALQTYANIISTMASYERRQQEWQYQHDLADWDITIADIGITIANDRLAIVGQEREIANLRLEFANDTVEFLGSKFTNKDLYRWMDKNLRKLYREQLNMAISTAKSAQRALEFERQSSLDFIGYDYWDGDKKGLLGAEQLHKDLEKMEQYRLTTASRKKEIEKTISLASVAPVEFQRFRETGLLTFETAARWFDQDFPGHYMRLIRNVSVSVLALIPPNQGIHATLSNPGISRAMAGPPFEEESIIYRLPESIAFSSPYNATGLFELSPADPMLFPFEGSSVATTWQLEMSKGANRFDYNTIFDILFTVRYTALDDSSYRTKVLDQMGQDEDGYVKTGANRYFSFRNEFPDQWYYFHNPVPFSEHLDPTTDRIEGNTPLPPYTMVIELKESDFVPNEDFRKIKNVTLAFQKSGQLQNEDSEIKVGMNFVPRSGSRVDSELTLNLKNRRVSTQSMNGKSPYGRWIIKLPENSDVSWLKEMEDLFLVIEYEAKVHYNR